MTIDHIVVLLQSPIASVVGIIVVISCLGYYYKETKKAVKNPTVGGVGTLAKNLFWGKPLVLFLILILLVLIAWLVNSVAVGSIGT